MLTINLSITPLSTNDTFKLCAGESILIHGQNQNIAGIYTQTFVTTSGCDSTSTVVLTFYPSPNASFSATPQSATLLSSKINFTDQSSSATHWNWNFGDVGNSTSSQQHPNYTYADTGNYLVTLIVNNEFGCADTLTQHIIISSDYVLYMPNSFTPNEDGLNDIFRPILTGENLTDFALYIFDRWGNMIFKSNDSNIGWDGRANEGKDIAQIDTYVWMMMIKDNLGNKKKFVGHVNLIK